MATGKIEERMAALEAEVERLKGQLGHQLNSGQPWWEVIAGTFADDPIYAEAMRLGREYRESLRDRKSTRLNSSHSRASRMPSSA